MADESSTESVSSTGLSLRLFDKMRVRRIRYEEIRHLLGPVDGQVALDLVRDPALSATLRLQYQQKGCRWHSGARTNAEIECLREMVGDKVHLLTDSRLPFENGLFDVMVVSDFLEYMPSDETFIAECHRILKPSGRLILCVPRAGKWSFLRFLRERLGLTDREGGPWRPGYSESQLFEALKDGFDMQESRTLIRFGTALADVFCQLMAGFASAEIVMADAGSAPRLRKALTWYSLLQPLFWLAAAADGALFFTRGSFIMARAKRRMWAPRRAPVLRDGRSIAEAALQSKIGTAAPF